MQINNLMTAYGNPVYYDPQFRILVESFIPSIRNDPRRHTVTITQDMTYRYAGDLIGLLDNLNVPRDYHWLVMRLNNMNDISKVDLNLNTLDIPPLDFMDHLRKNFLTKTSI